MGPNGDSGRALVIQPDGKYVVGGTAAINSSFVTDIALVRYNPNGTLDTSFDGDGRVTADLGGSDICEDIVLQGDGKIIVVGRVTNTFAAARFSESGPIDLGFGNGGKILTDIGTGNDQSTEAVLYGDKLIIAGDANFIQDLGLARYNLLPTPTATADFDGDGISDFSVFRPSSGTWFVLNSASGTVTVTTFGQNGDLPVDGDFDGDARADIAVWRPSSGTWFFKRSSDATFSGAPWGAAGDKPVPGDYDHDGKTDLAVWRPSDGLNYIVRSSNNSFFGVQWGVSGDIPVMGAAQ